MNTIVYGLVCSVSKEYEHSGKKGFWFVFHPHQKEFLDKSSNGLVAFGCGSSELLPLVPAAKFLPLLDGLNVTTKNDRYYWHVHLTYDDHQLLLLRKQGAEPIDITKYLLK